MLEKKKNTSNELRICSRLSVESTHPCHNINATDEYDNKHDSDNNVDICKRNVDRSKTQKEVNCQINTDYDNNVKINENTQIESGEEVNNKHVCCSQSKRFSVKNEKISPITKQEDDIKQTYVTDWVSHSECDRVNNFCDGICNSIDMNSNVDGKINETLSSSQRKVKEHELSTLSSTPMRMSRNLMKNHNKTILHHPNKDDISKTIMEIDMLEKNSRDVVDSNTDDSDNSVIANSILMKSITSKFLYYEQSEEQNETRLVDSTRICNKCTDELSFQQSVNELDNFLEKHKDNSSNYSNTRKELPEYYEVQKTLLSSKVHSHLIHPRPASMLNNYHDNNLISICAQRVSTDVPAQRNSYFEIESEDAILYTHNSINKTRNVHEPLPILANCELPLPFRRRAKTECVNGMLPESVNKSYIRTSSCRLPPLYILSEMDEMHNDDDDDDDNNDDNAEKGTHDSNIIVNVNKHTEGTNSISNNSRQINPDSITITENSGVIENNKNGKCNIDCLNRTGNEEEIFDSNNTETQKIEKSMENFFDANTDTNEDHWLQSQDNIMNRNECTQKQEAANFAKFTQRREVLSPIIISMKSSSETRSFNTLSNQFLHSEQTSPLLSSTITNLDLLSLDAPIDMCISSGESDAKDLSSGISISTAYFNVLAISTERINNEAANMHKMISMELSSSNPSHHCAKSVFSPFVMPPQHYVSPTHFSASRS